MLTAAIRLAFMSDTQETVTLRIPRASLSLTSPLVNAVMGQMVSAQVYDTQGRGNLHTPLSAELVLTDVVHFDVA